MSQFRNLVFEGGGVKGIAYAGALQILEQKRVLSDIKRTAGTSAGAITAALVALGASSQRVQEIVGGTKFRTFMDDSFGVVRDMNRLVNDYGWFKGEAFSGWLQKQIYSLCGKPDLTFGELRDRANKKPPFRELYVVGTNLTQQMPMIYSAEVTPNTPIWEAVRISMSIPLFFASVRVNPGNQVNVDGGVTWNYPLDLFDDVRYVEKGQVAYSKPNYPTKYDDNHVYNKETLGLRVDTWDEIKAEKETWNLPPAKIEDFFDYAKALVGFMGDMANKMHLHTNDWHRTIAIDAGGVRTTEFDLSDQKVNMLVENGCKGTEAYFKWFEGANSEPPPVNRE